MSCFWHLLLLLVTTCHATPDMLECGGLSTRIKTGAQIMDCGIVKVNDPGSAPFELWKHGGGKSDGYTNFSIKLSLNGRTSETSSVLIQSVDNNTLDTFNPSDPTFPLCNGDLHYANVLCPKCRTQIYAQPHDCLSGYGCTFGVKADAPGPSSNNMTVLIAWSKGEDGYSPGVVKYVKMSLASVKPPPPTPAPVPPKLPPCTDGRKSFCELANDPSEAACCNLEVHGCVCTNWGDYNRISKFCNNSKEHRGVKCLNKKGKCIYNGGEDNSCCPGAPQCPFG
jgi:hypothetical protein